MNMKTMLVFPPHGFVKLTNWHGSELDIVNAARVSFHNESESLGKRDEGLIRFLLKNNHGTPFEHGFNSSWHIRCPLFVAREWFRHRIGYSYNEESGRYTELRPDFYYPEEDAIRTQVGKPGSYTFEPLTYETTDREVVASILWKNSEDAYNNYQKLLSLGVAKEIARTVLPLNIYTEFRWTANARSIMNFLALRNSEHAMVEIRQYAKAVEYAFTKEMPVVHQAFIDANRVAP